MIIMYYLIKWKNNMTLSQEAQANIEIFLTGLQTIIIMAVFGMKTAHLMSEVAYLNAQIDWQMARYQLHKVLGLVDPIIK